jgi:hypothetical protein
VARSGTPGALCGRVIEALTRGNRLIGTLLLISVTGGQAPSSATVGDRQAAISGPAAAEFSAAIERYVRLRATLEVGLPALTGAQEPAAVRNREQALARRLRAARLHARQGDIFPSSIAAAFRRALRQEEDEATRRMIIDENPGSFAHAVNSSYPRTRPFSTMPPNILLRLPALPDSLEYRFVGSDLILHDKRANLIVDRIPEAISRSWRRTIPRGQR